MSDGVVGGDEMEFWEFVDKHFVPIVTLMGTLGEAFIGSFISSSNQRRLFKEEKKAEEQALERERHAKTIQIYNDFLEANGRSSLAGSVEQPEFQYKYYKNEIRPIFYKNISYLHNEIIDLILKVDDEISYHEYFMEGPYESEEKAIEHYSEIYRTIIKYIKKG